MKEGEGRETVEGDKSYRAIAVSWFMAIDGQTSIVFSTFQARGARAQCNIKHTISRFVFPREFIMDLAFNSGD